MSRLSWSFLALLLGSALASAASADVPPVPPSLHFRGVGSVVTARPYPDHAMFDVVNDTDRSAAITQLSIHVWDGTSNTAAMLRRVEVGGRTITGALIVPAGRTVRVTVHFDLPAPARHGDRWQMILSGQAPVHFETLPAIITRAHRDPARR